MKILNIVYIMLILTITACSDEFLELAPPSNANEEDFYKTEQDFNAGIMAAYAELQSGAQYGGNFFTLIGYRADNLETGSTASARHFIDAFNVTTSNEEVDETWQSIYQGIYRCNIILNKIEEISINQALKDQFIGEAKFIRALSYFNAVRFWGEVPLVVKPLRPSEATSIGRSPINEVYNLIIADLESAINLLPDSYTFTDIGRVTNGAARTLLGKVYLTRKNWPEAERVLSEVINAASYSLLPDIKQVFDTENKNNEELIFVIKYLKGTDQGHGLWFSAPLNGSSDVTPDLYESYDTGDLRLNLLERVESGDRLVVLKYFDELSTTLDAGNDFPVLRYADVLLMYAEALNEIGYIANRDAFRYLNEVRSRANLKAYTDIELPDQNSFREAIYLERRLEFPLENHRWFDLIRTGTAIQTMNSKTKFDGTSFDIKDHQLIYPVPESERQRFNNNRIFWQNPGY